MSKSKYDFYKCQGLCVRCGKSPIPGKARCQRCHDRDIRYDSTQKKNFIQQGLCRSCGNRPVLEGKACCFECIEQNNKRERNRLIINRDKCFDAYGGTCMCCGTKNRKYFTLDHIHNDGNTHRLQGYGSIYHWAALNNYPNFLQILCANCHLAKSCRTPCTAEDHLDKNG